MNKAEIRIPKQGEAWDTTVTKYPSDSDYVPVSGFTGATQNVETTSRGVAKKRKGDTNYNATTYTGPNKDLYEAIFSDGARHLLNVANGVLKYSSGGGTFMDVTSGYNAGANFEFALYKDRVYFGNGVDSPQVYDRATNYGGVVYTAPQTKVMGVQAPSSAPSVAVVAGGSVPVGAHTYKVTFLYYGSEESNGGPASGVATTTPGNQTVNLTSIPIGGYGVTARKIYRDDNDGVYVLVGTMSNNTATTFSDTVAAGTTPIPTDNNPPPQFKYILAFLDRNWIAGITGDPSVIRFSEAGMPNVFRTDTYLTCNPRDPITALVIFNDRIIVFNRNSMGQILGRQKVDFRYSEIPSTVGCVDNRSIQIRTVQGVPTLVWLSDRGVWGYNGSSVSYLSDEIEDLVNLNIQQASQVRGQNSQTTQTQFDNGTKSLSILTTGGVITQANPSRVWNDEGDWEGGSSLTNVATNDNSSSISTPTRHEITNFDSGSYANTEQVSSTLRTPQYGSTWTGESRLGFSTLTGLTTATGSPSALAQSFSVPRSGTLNAFEISARRNPLSDFVRLRVWNTISGQPGTAIWTSAVVSFSSGVSTIDGNGIQYYIYTGFPALAIMGGQTYWYGVESVDSLGNYVGHFTFSNPSSTSSYTGSVGSYGFSTGSGTWLRLKNSSNNSDYSDLAGGYTFTQSVVAISGTWTGPTYDSKADSAVAATIEHTNTLPGGTSTVTTVEASDVSDFTSGVISQTFNNLSGSSAVSLSNKRYWRIKLQLSSTDDRVTTAVGFPILYFDTTGTWISEELDLKEPTVFNALTAVSAVPSGTSVTVEIATASVSGGPYTAFTTVGAVSVQRYAKVRLIITTNAANSVTASVSSVTFNYTVSGTLISSGIDTGVTPAGWDIFQSDFALNGGTVTFELRSASTLGGLTAATWYAVTSGNFPSPSLPILQFVQWRVTLVSTAGNVPTIDSVTVNWFISQIQNSIRVASIFFDRSYYLAAAEFGNTTNNLVLQYDQDGKWRIFRGLQIATLSYFFNQPYYGDAVEGRVRRFLDSSTDHGNAITMIVDTKAFDLAYPDKTKILRKLYMQVTNTGGTYTPQFSVDDGTTWISMIQPETGLSYYASSSDGSKYTVRFVPNFALGQVTAGKDIKFRVTEATTNDAELHSLRAEVWLRAGEPLNG